MKLTKGRIRKLLSKQKYTRKRFINNINTNTNKETSFKSTKKNNYHKSFNLKNKSLKNIF